MARAKYQVLVIPYHIENGNVKYCIPTYCFKEARKIWGENCLVIPEYTFAARMDTTILELSQEHTKYEWVDYKTALKRLRYDSNKTALWELDSY